MAIKTSQARDGRRSLSFILEPEANPMTTGSLNVGDMGFILAKGDSSGFDESLATNTFYIATSALTLGTGDKFIKCIPYFLGHATDKSASYSKNIVDVTCDYDAQTNNQCDGQVSISGSISGIAVVETLGQKSGINILQSRFTPSTQIDKDGKVTFKEAMATEKDILLIIWNAREAAIGEYLDCDVIPALFSNLSKDAAYGSSQTFNVDYTGNYTDENGYIGGNFKIENVSGLMPSIARPSSGD